MPGAGADSRSTDPDPGHGVWRRTLISAWLAEILAITGFFFVMPFLRLFLRDELGVEDLAERSWWAGLVIGVPSFVMGFMAPIWGVFADRVGRKVMVLRAMFGGAVVLGLMGLVQAPWQLFALRMVQGAVTGTITASAALVASVTPSRRAGFSLGMMQAAVFAGQAVGPSLGGFVWDTFGARYAFFAASAILVASGVLLAVCATEGSAHPREARRREDEGSREGVLDVLRRPGFAGIIVLMLVIYASRSLPGAIFQEYAAGFAGPGSKVNTTVGALISVTAVAAAVASVTMGWLADRIGEGVLIVVGTIAGGVFCIPQAWISSLWALFVLRALIGVSLGATTPALGRFVHRAIPPASHGKAFGLVQSATSYARGVGVLGGGLVSAALVSGWGAEGALRIPFAASGVVQVLAGLGAWVVLARSASRLSARSARG